MSLFRERKSKLSVCLSFLGSSRRGSWERGWHIRTLQASAKANPLPSRIIRCHGNFLDMVLNSNRPDGSLFTIENIPARINLTNPDQNWSSYRVLVVVEKHPVHHITKQYHDNPCSLKGHSQLMHMRISYHFLAGLADLRITRQACETDSEKRIRNI